MMDPFKMMFFASAVMLFLPIVAIVFFLGFSILAQGPMMWGMRPTMSGGGGAGVSWIVNASLIAIIVTCAWLPVRLQRRRALEARLG